MWPVLLNLDIPNLSNTVFVANEVAVTCSLSNNSKLMACIVLQMNYIDLNILTHLDLELWFCIVTNNT